MTTPTPPPFRPNHPAPPYRPQHNPPYPPGYVHYSGPAFTAAQHGPELQRLPTPYPVTSTPHVIRGDRNGMGTAGLVLGIISLCFAVLPLVGLVAWVLWPLGTIFSGVGLNRCNQAIATNRNAALAGMIVSLVAFLVCVGWVVFTAYAASTGTAH